MKTRWVVILAVFLTLFLCFPASVLWSQEKGGGAAEDIEAIFDDTKVMFVGEDLYTVSIASRREEPLRRAPAAVTIIAGDELKRYITLKDALDSVPGFFSDRSEIKNRMYLRGIPDSFLVLMDGVPFSNETSTRDYPR